MVTDNTRKMIAAGLVAQDDLHPRARDFATVTVYRFRLWDVRADEWFVSARWATSEAIKRIGAEKLEGCHIEVGVELLNGDGMTERGYSPSTNFAGMMR